MICILFVGGFSGFWTFISVSFGTNQTFKYQQAEKSHFHCQQLQWTNNTWSLQVRSSLTSYSLTVPVTSACTHANSCKLTLLHTHTPKPHHARVPSKNLDPEPKPRNPQVGAVQLDALTNLFGANCQWETSARTALDKTGCWGEQIPLHEGGGQWGANVLMCGRWLGRDNGRISQSSGWLIWDGSSQPLTVGSPIVPLLIPTSHKLQTKVNLFLKGGGEISTRVSAGESDSKTYLPEMPDSLTPLPLFMSFFFSPLLLHPPHLQSSLPGGGVGWWDVEWSRGFQTRVGLGHLLEA